jgi:hypothetical protein
MGGARLIEPKIYGALVKEIAILEPDETAMVTIAYAMNDKTRFLLDRFQQGLEKKDAIRLVWRKPL